MNKGIGVILILCASWMNKGIAQPDFEAGFYDADPVLENSDPTFIERVELHKSFLAKAKQNKDSLHQLYGYLYLASDYINYDDFANATPYLIEAERFAASSGNAVWQGVVSHRRGSLYTYLDNYEVAIKYFKLSLSQSGQGKDSLYMAYNLEQLGAMYGYLEHYDTAHQYYQQLFPFAEKFFSNRSLNITYANYGNMVNQEGRFEEALDSYNKALHYLADEEEEYLKTSTLLNIANVLANLEQLDTALQLYQNCLLINQEYNWLDNLVTNYVGISRVYELMNQDRLALYYYKEYELLQDSIMGVEVQQNIADLEHQNEVQQMELDLAKTQQKLERRGLLAFFVLLFAGLGIYYQYRQKRRVRLELIQNRANLIQLTQTLVQKNSILRSMEEKISEFSTSEETVLETGKFEEQLYNHNILTHDDWTSFKSCFENTLPGYILHLRSVKPDLSEAEERLFLLLKLELTRKEIAAILGISPDSVKRTRIRLRKRLEMDKDDSLEGYIRNF